MRSEGVESEDRMMSGRSSALPISLTGTMESWKWPMPSQATDSLETDTAQDQSRLFYDVDLDWPRQDLRCQTGTK